MNIENLDTIAKEPKTTMTSKYLIQDCNQLDFWGLKFN